MPDEMHGSFDYMVNGAAHNGPLFLKTVQDRCNAQDLGIKLAPKAAGKGRTVMHGEVVMGRAFRGRVPFHFQVFADRKGPLLHVGYQLTTTDTPAGYGYRGRMGEAMYVGQQRVIADPDTQRQLSGMIQAFHLVVFDPTLRQLVESVGGNIPSNGFMGA
ncbi:hypothetical protein [Rudaeicoccus suwonensis]|uniref:Uncharacterized protein n=1 Tax=Rudaeicoccus suwonensis TaxID=657409 RepID=A0A561E4G2_9MICO|nr:hypothetical protein [Rudaeicoccus suwonensis]TWE10499.1 hypothetical protein BKA23_2865 [Rudaeicoccus suwonensis]